MTGVTLWLSMAALAVSVVVGFAFVALFGSPLRNRALRGVALNLVVFALGYAVESLLLLLLTIRSVGRHVPLWLFPIAFWTMALTSTQRLYLLVQTRRQARAYTGPDSVLPGNTEGQGDVTPATQTRHPWRATLRTLVAAAVGVLPLLPEILGGLHIGTAGTAGQFLVVTAGITRLLARPDVERWLHEYAPWLAAQPAPVPVQPPVG